MPGHILRDVGFSHCFVFAFNSMSCVASQIATFFQRFVWSIWFFNVFSTFFICAWVAEEPRFMSRCVFYMFWGILAGARCRNQRFFNVLCSRFDSVTVLSMFCSTCVQRFFNVFSTCSGHQGISNVFSTFLCVSNVF